MHRLCLLFLWFALASASLPSDYLLPDQALVTPTFRFPDPTVTGSATASRATEENQLGLVLGPPADWLDEPPFVGHCVDIATGQPLAEDATRDAKLDQQMQHLLKRMGPIDPSRISFAKPIASSQPLPPLSQRASNPPSLTTPSSPPVRPPTQKGKEPVRGRDVPINFNDDEDKAKSKARPSLRRRGSSASSLHSIASTVSGKIKRNVLKRTKSDLKRNDSHDHVHPSKEGQPCSVCDQRERDALRAESARMDSLIIPTAVWRTNPPRGALPSALTMTAPDNASYATAQDRPTDSTPRYNMEGRHSAVHPSGGTEEFIAWQRHIVNNLDAVAGCHSHSTPRATMQPSPLSHASHFLPSGSLSQPSYLTEEDRPSSGQLLDPTYHAVFLPRSSHVPVPSPRRPLTSTYDPEVMPFSTEEQYEVPQAPPQRFSQLLDPAQISTAVEEGPAKRPKSKKSLRSLFQRNKDAERMPSPRLAQ